MSTFLRRRAVIRFGDFEANLRRSQLRKQGQPVDIQEKPFQILVALLEKSGEIVGRDELRTRLWSKDSHGDMEHNINVCVAKLRHALLDSVKNPRYIQTISTRGYCFIAPVEVEEEQPQRQSARIRLAVLPFESWNTPPEQSHFSEGLVGEISSRLGHLYPDQLGVIARSSILKYRGTAKNSAQIGRELKVDYILETSVQIASDHLHITAQLVQVKDQTYLWAESYDYNLDDPITIQSEIAERVARALGLKLLPARSAPNRP